MSILSDITCCRKIKSPICHSLKPNYHRCSKCNLSKAISTYYTSEIRHCYQRENIASDLK